MKRASFFASCLILATVVFAQSSVLFAEQIDSPKKSDNRPNIILIMADDVGYECFGCYGSKQYRTPNIDRLAAAGMKFNHCYSQPICTPSRIKIMTGKSNARNYSAFSVLNPDQKTIGHFFQDAGYETVVAGKWQLLGASHYSKQFRKKGTWPQKAGFDRHCLWQVDQLGLRFWDPLLYIDGENQKFAKDDYGPEQVNNYVTEFMESRDKEKPFFIYYPMILVHNPFPPTPDSEQVKKAGGKNASKGKNQQHFEDMVTYMDKMIGNIVDKTKELGIEKETLILFTGDNGTNKVIKSKLNGRNIQGGKGLTTDDGTREPLVAYWPGQVPAGTVSESLVDFSDFLPTLMEAAGESAPAGLDGRSFLPQLLGGEGSSRKWMYCYYCPRPEKSTPVRFVRDKRFKLYGDGRFFDVLNDVQEKQTLNDLEPGSPAAEAKAQLESALESMPAKGQSLLKFVPNSEAASKAPPYKDPNPNRYALTARASQIDSRAKEHPEINFTFSDAKGAAVDMQHAVVDTRVAPRGKLVIWLMRHNEGLFERISGYGMHGIQVHYANRWFGLLDAKDRDDGVSLGKVRLEAATGEDHSPLVEIPKPDGMKQRSLQFVKWLVKEHPQGNWAQFLNDAGDDLLWDKVIVSGISHGSTTAARFVKHQKVARVVMFSGPRDQLESWQGFPSATPSNRYFGFTHVLDGGWTGDHYCRSWEMLGLHSHGPIVNVDEVESPWQNSRRLVTTSDVNKSAKRAHTTVVPGGSAVKNADGQYIHEDVWRYLFTHPVEQAGEEVAADPGCKKNQRK